MRSHVVGSIVSSGPELVKGDLCSEQLVDGVGHPLKHDRRWDISADRVSSKKDLIQAKERRGRDSNPRWSLIPILA
jgi:hypothetical protein